MAEPTIHSLPGPQARSDAPKSAGLEVLLQIEAQARRAESTGELAFIAANETLRVSRARQIFVLDNALGRPRLQAVSSIGQFDRNAPRIRWIEAVVAALQADVGIDGPSEFALPAYGEADTNEAQTYPFRYMRWLPFVWRDGKAFGGMLLARELPWNEADCAIAERLSETFAHAYVALAGPRALKRRTGMKPIVAVAAVALVAAAVIPVPLTVLAPAEVTSIGLRIVAAPLDGVVRGIAVEPNQAVREGDVLFSMSDTVLRNDLEVAERDVDVAAAALKRIDQAAMADPKMRGEMAVARTELALAVAKRDFARELFDRGVVRAPISGIALFTERRDWEGRPVSTGERIVEIADPDRLELRIDVPVADAIALREGASVRGFLDSDPLRPVEARIRSHSFEARRIEDNTLVYRAYAEVTRRGAALRLGVRGTAQISGDRVPLAFLLFRRPIAAARQWIGL